ncbi:MAG: carbon-nitrogen hydrolase family protein [Sphingomonadaceae bacterium]
MRIAVYQMASGIDPYANCVQISEAIATAATNGAAMLFTPEMSNMIDSDRSRSAAKLSTEDDDTVLKAICKAAASHRMWVHIGSMAFAKQTNGDQRVNRGIVIDDNGQIRARYDKLHLFDVDLPSGERWRESSVYGAGAGAVSVATPVGTVGLSICYDLRFPALYQSLSNSGADVLAIPAAFTVPTGKAHWHTLLRARAIENAAWVVAAAQSGAHEDGRATFGHSLVVDPWGDIVLDMADKLGVGYAEIDHARTADVRARIPVLAHRRSIPDVVIAQ